MGGPEPLEIEINKIACSGFLVMSFLSLFQLARPCVMPSSHPVQNLNGVSSVSEAAWQFL